MANLLTIPTEPNKRTIYGTTSSNEREPCPFCDNKNISIVHNREKTSFWGRCRKCYTTGPVRATAEEAQKAWNMRVALPELPLWKCSGISRPKGKSITAPSLGKGNIKAGGNMDNYLTIPAEIHNISELSLGERYVLAFIYNLSRGRPYSMSNKQMAINLNVTERTVIRTINRLTEKGFITIDRPSLNKRLIYVDLSPCRG